MEKDLDKGDLGSDQDMKDMGEKGQDNNEVQGGGGSEQSSMRVNPEKLPTTSSSILTGGHVPISEMGLVPFTPSKQYDVACLEDIHFYPKTNSIV